MKTSRIISGLVAALSLSAAGTYASEDNGVAPASNKTYANECSACHIAYPPGLLSSASWKKVFANLGDHFGENAELPAGVAKELTEYTVANAADKSGHSLSQKIMRSYGSATPMRISEVPYIAREHREIFSRYVKGNPQVGSLSKCQLCHKRAEQGSFSEREIDIPGHGRWED